jgi:hypothetical protein
MTVGMVSAVGNIPPPVADALTVPYSGTVAYLVLIFSLQMK